MTAPRSFAPRQRESEREELTHSTRRRIERSVSGGTADEPQPEPAARDTQLLEVLRRTGETGPGMEMLERRTPTALASFYTERAQLKGQSKKKLKSVKNLVIHREPEDVQMGLRVSRREEG